MSKTCYTVREQYSSTLVALILLSSALAIQGRGREFTYSLHVQITTRPGNLECVKWLICRDCLEKPPLWRPRPQRTFRLDLLSAFLFTHCPVVPDRKRRQCDRKLTKQIDSDGIAAWSLQVPRRSWSWRRLRGRQAHSTDRRAASTPRIETVLSFSLMSLRLYFDRFGVECGPDR